MCKMRENVSRTRKNTRWWFVWLAATLLLPGLASFFQSEVTLLVCVASLALHLVASIKLDMAAFWQSALLFWGGWLLAVASFFVGCVSVLE